MRAILLISALLALSVAAEAAYRLYRYHELQRQSYQHTRYAFSSTEAPIYAADRDTGYIYRPNAKLHFRLYDKDNHLVRENHFTTNNFGHLSPGDDALEKPNSEFRIAVLGDSFSATPTSDVTWPTALERLLNRDVAAKRVARKTSFKVINFALDGTGLVQWPHVYRYKAKAFGPDLAIVNFIGNDLYRRFIFRDTITLGKRERAMLTCSSLPVSIANANCLNARSFVMDPKKSDYLTQAAQIKNELYDKIVARLPWSSLKPGLPFLLLSRATGIRNQFELESGSMFYFKSSEKAIAESQAALKAILLEQHAMMVLHHPTYEECVAKRLPPDVRELMDRETEIKIEDMLNFMPTVNQEEIKKWYNLPYDAHPSDYGAEVYARAVESRVLAYLRVHGESH